MALVLIDKRPGSSALRDHVRAGAKNEHTDHPVCTHVSTHPLRAGTGIRGLDDILSGGLLRDRLYLLEGMPGSGKTTLALQFLMEGARMEEPVLYVTLSETEEELRVVAQSHGWRLDGVAIRELTPSVDSLAPEEQYTVFHPS